MSVDYSSEDDNWEPSGRRSRRIKTNSGKALRAPKTTGSPFESLGKSPLLDNEDFEEIFQKEDYLAARLGHQMASSEPDPYNNRLRPLTLAELHSLREWFESTTAAGKKNWTTGEAILMRRLKLRKLKRFESAAFSYDSLQQPEHGSQRQALAVPPPTPSHPPPPEETIDSLYSIRKTPYLLSFASRLCGGHSAYGTLPHLMHRDWETQAAWMDLLSDIRLHRSLLHPDEETPDDVIAPIDYVSLQRAHLPQVHDLLTRTFWDGINVSDSLQHSPKQCTIIAIYKRLVVGAAFLSSPEETYLTYLVVRPGWENAHIASVMLYHLIAANPRRDITLHVSANSPAMILYNKFGFKAEEFIVGFYEDYLPKESKACKNAFRLRLRR